MSAPLSTRDARELQRLTRPRMLRRALAWAALAAASVVAGLHATFDPVARCSDSAPCRPDAAGALVVGLLLAAGLAGFMQARAAAWLSGGFVLAAFGYDLLRPGLASPFWLYGPDVAFAGLCVALAAVGRARRLPIAAEAWLAGALRTPVPEAPAIPRLGRGWLVAGVACLMLALGLGVWTWWSQSRMADREERAATVTAEVVAHVDEFAVRLRMPDGTLRAISVMESANYPVGQRMQLYVDGEGMRQPVSEPYDASGWLFLAVLAGGLGLASVARGRVPGTALRNLFAEEQPATLVYVRRGLDNVAVYPGDARPGEPATAEVRHVPTDVELSTMSADESDVDDDRPRILLVSTRPAVLYGIPAPDRWCSIVVDGETLVPVRPLRSKFHAPVFSDPTADGAPEPATEREEPVSAPTGVGDLPLRAEEIDALAPADRDEDPHRVRVHMQRPIIGYAFTAALPLVLVVPSRVLSSLPYPAALIIAGVTMALSCVIGWWLFLRSRLAWNGGGIAAVGITGTVRTRWQHVRGIENDRHSVTIQSGYQGIVVGATRAAAVVSGADRDGPHLANALRYARDNAISRGDPLGPEPPRLTVPRPSVALYAVWLLCTPLLALLLHFFAEH